jgi:hypothetical protein
MAHDVFISHAADDRVVALAVCAKLEANRIRCRLAPRDPIAEIPSPRRLADAIAATNVVLLIFSRSTNTSEDVLRELGEATNRDKPIIPLQTDDILPTGDLKYYTQAAHWLDGITPPFESRLDELVTYVRRFLDRPRPIIDPPVAVRPGA